MWQIMVFFLGAIAMAIYSSRYFSNPRSHGFFRFLAFVAVWAVFVINLPWWTRDVLSARQIISWVILAGALALAIAAYVFLRGAERSGRKKTSTVQGLEAATGLVTIGPYRYIRHPFFASLVLLAWGLALKSGSFGSIVFALLSSGLLYLTALTEEEENLERFGGSYEEYISATHMFVPGLF